MEKESRLPVAGGHSFSLSPRGDSGPIPALNEESSIDGGGKAGGRVNMGRRGKTQQNCSQLYSKIQTVKTCNQVKRLALS